MNYKLGLIGATGRMGLEIAALSASGFWVGDDCMELAIAVGSNNPRFTSVEGVPVASIMDFPNELPHVWVDFSRPEATMTAIEKINCPIFVGTTGFTEGQMNQLKRFSEKHPVLLAANTSPGMNRMMSMLRHGPQGDSGAEVVLFEEHHKNKKDAPSGTAKELLNILGKQGHEVQVLVSRSGGTKGIHSIRYVWDDEELEIIHRVNERRVFAKGALLGAHFLCRVKRPGLYAMADVFEVQKGGK